MTKKTAILISAAVVLGIAYFYFFSDRFNQKSIQIIPQIRPSRPMKSLVPDVSVYPVSFTFDQEYRITSLKVVAVAEAKKTKFPVPQWHLISESNSVPLRGIQYGVAPKGMKPATPNSRPEALLPDVAYRLEVQSGKMKGKIDFKTREAVTPNR